MADCASGELQEVAVLCCNPNGTLRTPVSSVIGNKQRVMAAGKGGFVYINELHVAKDHRKKGLSLVLIRGLLKYLGSRWTLATIFPVPWSHADRNRQSDPASRPQKILKIAKHFAKVGFVQVKDSGFWFIERSQLKEADVDTSNLEVVRDEPVDERPKLEGINLSLFELAGAEQSFQVFESLVRNGASIDTTCSMHKAAALGLLKNVTLFIKLGGNVNHKDEFGNTPLHVAVLELNPNIISLLVKNGADVNIACKKGSKPADLLESTMQSTTDFLLTFGMDHKITAEKAKFAAIKQLLVSPKKQIRE
ncbi:hypothetical protein HDU99_003608 [Rhizoclosmatium hyalinum]|nr:hypothetical protein HDU99_003608 [Rhizoclosmatium hyalinum]